MESQPVLKKQFGGKFRIKKKRESMDDSTLQDDQLTRDMIFNHIKGSYEQRFVKNESIDKILTNKKYRKQAMYVNMGR